MKQYIILIYFIKVTKLILERKGEYENEIKEEEQKGKENDQIRILEMDNKKLKEQLENQGKENTILKVQMANKDTENMNLKEQIELLKKKLEEKEKNQKTGQNMINKKEETKQF